jgi:hypothetical protein
MKINNHVLRLQRYQENKDKVDFLFRLEESSWREFNERRSYEWKINFALWAGLGTLSGFSIKENIQFSWLIWLGLSLIFFVFLWWHHGLFIANQINKKSKGIYLDEIRNKIGLDFPADLNNRPKTAGKYFFTNWSQGTQIVITFLFLFLTGYVLTARDQYSLKNHNETETINKCKNISSDSLQIKK